MVEDGLRMAQCWLGVEKLGNSRFKSGNKGGLGEASWPSNFEAGWRR